MATSVNATPTISVDQSQSSAPMFIGQFWQLGLAQSFTAGAVNISGAGAYLYYPAAEPITIDFAVWTAPPTRVGATRLAGGSTVAAAGESWVDAFWQPVATTIGATYYLTFHSTSQVNGIGGTLRDSYAGGNTWANGGYDKFVDYDYAFRTYTTPESTNTLVVRPAVVTAVPEPSEWSLMLAGLALAGTVLRRRRFALKR